MKRCLFALILGLSATYPALAQDDKVDRMGDAALAGVGSAGILHIYTSDQTEISRYARAIVENAANTKPVEAEYFKWTAKQHVLRERIAKAAGNPQELEALQKQMRAVLAQVNKVEPLLTELRIEKSMLEANHQIGRGVSVLGLIAAGAVAYEGYKGVYDKSTVIDSRNFSPKQVVEPKNTVDPGAAAPLQSAE